MPKAPPAAASNRAPNQRLVTELKVTGHLMTLDAGLYSILHTPSRAADPATGLPGVRISVPPGPASRPEAVSVTSFRPDGWLSGFGDAALVRVLGGPAQILVTVYQAPNATEGAPNLQVQRLLEALPAPRPGVPQGQPQPAMPAPAPAPAQARPEPARAPVGGRPAAMEIVAHVQERGDVGAMLGGWVGERGSKRWIEGFGIAPLSAVSLKDIEYQAVLGRGWLSPWVEGGQFCGSRGMALPILGLRVRLRGPAAESHEVTYSATFVDGTAAGPAAAGEPCEAESLAPVEAFQVVVRPKGASAPPADAATESAEPDVAPKAEAAAPRKAPAKGKARKAPSGSRGR